MRIVGGLVPLVVVVFEGCVLAEEFGTFVDVAGPVDTAADAVIAGVTTKAAELTYEISTPLSKSKPKTRTDSTS